MVSYLSSLSKYFIIVFMCLYTLECFLVFRFKTEKQRKYTYIRQVIYLIGIHFTCFLSICLKTGDMTYLLFYAIFQAFILLIIEVLPMIYPRINRLLINNSCLLISIGLIILVRLNFSSAVKQLIITCISFIIAAFLPFVLIKIKKIPNKPYLYACIGTILLTLVNLLGKISNGSKLSISILGISFMPSEFVKILFVLFVAGSLYKDKSFKNICITTFMAAAHVIILALSNDLGAALILFVVYVLMVFLATRNYFYLGLGTMAGVAASLIAYKFFSHVRVRVMAFRDPFSVIDNEGYQISQSLFALSSGSYFGMGLFEGTPDSIPYVETDFIFSAITQEFGIIFSICFILVCLSCFIMFLNISFKFTNLFYRYISFGLGVTYIFQVFLTIGGGTKFIPLTGVTLPLVSYGGSSVMATVISFFIIESLYIIRGNSKFDSNDSLVEEKTIKYLNRISLGISYLFISLFIGLSTYLVIYVSKNEQVLLDNSYNPVQEVMIKKTIRGNIYSRDNEILATTEVDKEGNENRFYPFYNIFSHAVGYSTNGKLGVEGQANYYLINSNMPFNEKITADITSEKYQGDGVKTTLDVGLQKVAYSAMGTYNGAIVVSNPKTGEILAMVSKPDFDPNEISDIWDDLINDSSSSVLLNRATQGLYPPGSTFKIVTLLEYIRQNPDSYNDFRFNCTGASTYDTGGVICYNHQSHGYIDLKKAFAQSCNCGFGNIGLQLDRPKFQETLNDLLFNNDLPLVTNYAQSTCTVSDDFDDLLMVQTAFGQGNTLMSPIHINLITQAIANKGMLMKPYIISEVVNNEFSVIKEFEPQEYKRLMSEEEAATVTNLMEAVVTEGTGKKLKKSSASIACKTGTAEFNDFSTSTHSLVTGFAPSDDPEICVTVVLEDAGPGNLYAVPVAKKIFEEYFRRYDTSEYIDEK